jgi:hypothetical protein
MWVKVAALRQEMVVRPPAVLLAAAAVILAAMVARQIEQEKPQKQPLPKPPIDKPKPTDKLKPIGKQ